MTAHTFMEYIRKTRRGQVKLTPRQIATLIFLAALVFLCALCVLYLSMRPTPGSRQPQAASITLLLMYRDV